MHDDRRPITDSVPTGARCLACLTLMVALLLAAPGVASAASIGATRTRAAQVMAQIDRLDGRRADAARQERAATARLAGIRLQLAATEQHIAIAQDSLKEAEAELSALLVSSYKESVDPAAFLLGAGSFGDLIARVDVVNRVSDSEGQMIGRIGRVRGELRDELAAQQRARVAAEHAAALATAARRSVDRLLARRHATLGALTARIADQIAREQRRRANLADSTGTTSGGGGSVAGKVFYGEATWYGTGSGTASGEPFDPWAMTCASPWLPFGTMLRVTLLSTGRSVVVRVNDRGPFGGGVIDLTLGAARVVGLVGVGRGQVRVEVIA